MCRIPSQLIGLLVLTVFCVSTKTQQLSVVEVAEIPHMFYGSSAFYDGDEWIYTLHTPYDNIYNPQLWRLSVSNYTLEKVAEYPDFLNSYRYGTHLNDTAYFFGDSRSQSSIIQFNIRESTDLTLVPEMDLPLSLYSTAVTHNNEVIIICSYYCDHVYKFSPDKPEIRQMGQIPAEHLKRFLGSAVVKNKVYLFGTTNTEEPRPNETHSVLNLDTMEFEKGQGNLDYLKHDGVPSATTDGELIYLIPSHADPTTARLDGIYQINPETNTHQFLPVENFPVNNEKYFLDAPASIYVEKVNGIFMIGGRRRTVETISPTEYMRQIHFIDLSPLNPPPTTTTLSPDLFTCGEHTDGFYPNPLDCAKFIGCHDGVAEYYECPQLLLFDPLLGTCNSPQLVECDISCAGKPDGLYPHPHDCSLFITCVTEDLDIYKCPPPLLFDAVNQKCNFPEEVNC